MKYVTWKTIIEYKLIGKRSKILEFFIEPNFNNKGNLRGYIKVVGSGVSACKNIG